MTDTHAGLENSRLVSTNKWASHSISSDQLSITSQPLRFAIDSGASDFQIPLSHCLPRVNGYPGTCSLVPLTRSGTVAQLFKSSSCSRFLNLTLFFLSITTSLQRTPFNQPSTSSSSSSSRRTLYHQLTAKSTLILQLRSNGESSPACLVNSYG